MKKLTNLLVFLSLNAGLFAQTPVWKNYLSYQQKQEIAQAHRNLLYVLASQGLYAYHPNDRSIHTFDKVNGLADAAIAHISYNTSAHRLVVVYVNGNIDLLDDDGQVTHLSAYRDARLTADKTVNSICQHGNDAFLATGFGIVRLNIARAEVSDTYNLSLPVAYCWVEQQLLKAASPTAGMLQCPLNSNLADPLSWQHTGAFVAQTPVDNTALWAKVAQVSPDGPAYNHFGFMRFHNHRLYTCGGKSEPFRPGCVQVMHEGRWQVYAGEADIQPLTHLHYQDVCAIDIDPRDENHLFAGARNGLYEFQNGRLKAFYNDSNSPIGTATANNDREYQLVTGVKFDATGQLWLFNSQSLTASLLRFDGQQWHHPQLNAFMTFGQRSLANGRQLQFFTPDALWLVNDNWTRPSLYRVDAATERITSFTTFVNQDGQTVDNLWYVRCIARDKMGNLWVGTNVGPLVLSPEEAQKANPIFEQIKIPRNDGTTLADYLLSGVDITNIVIDNANRKWMATQSNGLYLVSSDNQRQLAHYTAENSPLLSNAIESLAFDNTTGTLYIGTASGLCSVQSEAFLSADALQKDQVYAYPNPVEPGYTGPINIVGLIDNSDVKITTVDGRLVKQGRSNGALFSWDGTNQHGQRVASGIYLVEVATPDGTKGVVCRVAIVN